MSTETMVKERAGRRVNPRRKWLPLLIAIVLLAGVGYGAYSLFAHSGTDFIPLSQFMQDAESMRGRIASVGGKVLPGSINWDAQAKVMEFTLMDGRERLAVTFQGFVPDDFGPGVDLVVKGRYGTDNVFMATDFGNKRSLCNICH